MRPIIALAAALCLAGCSRTSPSAYQPPQPMVQQTQPMTAVASVEQQLALAGLKPSDASAFAKKYSQICVTAKMSEMELMPVITKLLHAAKGNAKRVTADLELLEKYHTQKPKSGVWENAVMVIMMGDAGFAPAHLMNKTDVMNIYRKLAAR